MTDTASLVVRVKTDGAVQAEKQLGNFATAAALAESASNSLGQATKKTSTEQKKAESAIKGLSSATESLGNAIAILETAQEEGARSATVFAAQLKLGSAASAEESERVAELAGRLFDLRDAEAKAAEAATKEMMAQKLAAQEREKSAAVVSNLQSNLLLLKTAQEKGATAAATLANQLRAGDAATEEQRAEIARLTAEINKYTGAAGGSSKGSSAARNAMQQVGFQAQDMVVQLQSGTSAFVAIGQQGSQLAGAFGPGGAVLGAVIALASAVGGVLYKSMNDTAGSTKDLEAAQKQLKDTFQQTTTGAMELTDGMIQLSAISKEAAETQLSLAKANAELISKQASDAIKKDAEAWETWKATTTGAISQYDALINKGRDVTDTLDKLAGTYEGNIVGVNILSQNINEMSESFGVNRDQALAMIAAQSEFNKQPTAENARKISDVFTQWLGATNKLNPELIRLTDSANKNASAMESAEKSANAASEAQKKLGNNVNSTSIAYHNQTAQIIKSQQISVLSDKERAKAQGEEDKKMFAQRKSLTDADITAYNSARDKQTQKDIAAISAREAQKSNKIELSTQKTAAQQKKAADAFIDGVNRTGADEIANITATEQQKLDTLKEFQQKGAISAKEYEDTKTKIQLDADAARKKAEEGKKQKTQKIVSEVDPVAKLAQQRDEQLKVIAEYDALENSNHALTLEARAAADEKYNEGVSAALEDRFKKQSEVNEFVMDSLDELGNTASSSIVGILEGTQSASKAMANLGKTILNSVVSSLVDMGVQYVKNLIIGKAAQTAATAAAVASGSAMAAAYAPAAALASLASFGANSAAAMIGISSTVATAEAVSFAGLREQGGSTRQGGAYGIAERGKAEVIMPAGASRVRTAQQMRQIMGDDSANKSGGDSVVIVNNTSGRIDSAQTERDDEGRLRIIISEQMAAETMNENSGFSKARRATRNQPGYG